MRAAILENVANAESGRIRLRARDLVPDDVVARLREDFVPLALGQQQLIGERMKQEIGVVVPASHRRVHDFAVVDVVVDFHHHQVAVGEFPAELAQILDERRAADLRDDFLQHEAEQDEIGLLVDLVIERVDVDEPHLVLQAHFGDLLQAGFVRARIRLDADSLDVAQLFRERA
ncbi:hypothetical protein Y033_5376 [Burkholderia pseudomallei MSHR435]|nr:hypothetical protein Y033_5376 [Burkholderia pseudomallei MSHR435]